MRESTTNVDGGGGDDTTMTDGDQRSETEGTD